MTGGDNSQSLTNQKRHNDYCFTNLSQISHTFVNIGTYKIKLAMNANSISCNDYDSDNGNFQYIGTSAINCIIYNAQNKVVLNNDDYIISHNFQNNIGYIKLNANCTQILAWLSGSTITNIVFPYQITQINSSALRNCTLLSTLNLDNYITSIGNQAFENCISLENIKNYDTINYIGSSAFNNCKSLKNIISNTSINSINEFTYNNCVNLTSIYLYNTLSSIANNAFENCSSITDIYTTFTSSNIISASPWGANNAVIHYKNQLYTELEYLQGTGTQYIDTGLIPYNSTTYSADIEVLFKYVNQGDYSVFGTLNDNFSFGIGVPVNTFGCSYKNGVGSSVSNIPADLNIKHILHLQNGLAVVDDISYSFTPVVNYNNNKSIYIFSSHYSSTYGTSKQCIYSAKFYDNGILKGYFIPVLWNTNIPYIDGNTNKEVISTSPKPGMYDKVTGKLFINQGLNQFIFYK